MKRIPLYFLRLTLHQVQKQFIDILDYSGLQGGQHLHPKRLQDAMTVELLRQEHCAPYLL